MQHIPLRLTNLVLQIDAVVLVQSQRPTVCCLPAHQAENVARQTQHYAVGNALEVQRVVHEALQARLGDLG